VFRSFLSWRYLLHRRTNLIGIGGIFVAVAALILILSIMTGFLEETRATVRGSLSDIVITPSFGGPGHSVPTRPEPMVEVVRQDPRVAATSAHLVWFGMIAKSGDEALQSRQLLANSQSGNLSAVQLVGIDVEDEYATTNLRDALEREPHYGVRVEDPRQPFAPPPEFRQEGRERRSVVVGEQLFHAHQLARGQVVTLMTITFDPKTGELLPPSNREFVIAGTFRSRENEMDLQRIYLERSELSDFLGGDLTFSEVLVRLKDYDRDGPAARNDLQQALKHQGLLQGYPGEVRTWEEFRSIILGAIENERVLMAIMLSLVLLVAGFTIFAILSMMVTEKRRDIGILTALGATPNGVMTSFLMIAFWDALLGTTLGAVAGTWAAMKIDGIERWLSDVFGIQIFNRNVYLFDTIPSVVEPLPVALIVWGAFTCALLFAAIPAWKAARLDPLDALRYE
jgi:lipoprotein-releasing system permease protein